MGHNLWWWKWCQEDVDVVRKTNDISKEKDNLTCECWEWRWIGAGGFQKGKEKKNNWSHDELGREMAIEYSYVYWEFNSRWVDGLDLEYVLVLSQQSCWGLQVSEVCIHKIEETCMKMVRRSIIGQMKKRNEKGQDVGNDGF